MDKQFPEKEMQFFILLFGHSVNHHLIFILGTQVIKRYFK
jgi:hypothetical protein